MDLGCLKPGKKVSFDQFFDPKDVYDRGCTDVSQADSVQLPDSRTGLIMVYRVFDRVSYALIMQSSGPVYLLRLPCTIPETDAALNLFDSRRRRA